MRVHVTISALWIPMHLFHPVGVVVPVTCKGGAHTRQGYEWDDKSPCLARFQVSGFCFLFKKEMLRDIGYFDERFYLHGQDSEWMDRVIESKWRIVMRRDVYVDHLTSASIEKASKDNEFHYNTDILLTQRIYAIIREEKKRKKYKPPQYSEIFETVIEEFVKEVL
jgi:GT2 family glycosyltransferase